MKVTLLLKTILVAALTQTGAHAAATTTFDSDQVRALEQVFRDHAHPESAFPGPGPDPILLITWFAHGDPRVAFWTSVDRDGKTREYQVSFNGGGRGSGVGPAVVDIQKLRILLSILPAEPQVHPPEARWILLSFKDGSEWRTRIYDRGDLSPELDAVFREANAHVARWLPTLEPLRSIGLSNEVTALDIAPDGRTLASGDRDSMVRLWYVKNGAEILQIDEHFQAPVQAVLFLPDGNTLVAASHYQLAINEAKTGARVLAWHALDAYVLSAAVSPDGQTLATCGGPVMLWDCSTGKELARLGDRSDLIRTVAISTDGKRLAAGGDNKMVRLWDIATRKEVANLGQSQPITGLAFDPKGSRLAVAPLDFTLHFTIWDLAAGKESGALECVTDTYTEGASAIAWSPDGQMLAIGAANGPIQLWRSLPARPLALLVGHRARITRLAFLPDNATLASASRDRTIKVWDFEKVASGSH